MDGADAPPLNRDVGLLARLLMVLSSYHWRFLAIHQSAVPALINFVLNGAIAWWLFRSVAFVPFSGLSSIAGDTLITSFLLPFLSCLIITWLIQRGVERGELRPLVIAPEPGWQVWLSQVRPLRRGVFFGLVGVVFSGAPVCVVFARLGPPGLSFSGFVSFKAAYAALLAAAVCPFIAWLALASPSPVKASRP